MKEYRVTLWYDREGREYTFQGPATSIEIAEAKALQCFILELLAKKKLKDLGIYVQEVREV